MRFFYALFILAHPIETINNFNLHSKQSLNFFDFIVAKTHYQHLVGNHAQAKRDILKSYESQPNHYPP